MASGLVKPKLKIKLSDGTTRYTKNVTQRKISGILTNLKAKSATIRGEARVEYAPDYYNEFDFNGEADFKRKVLPCIEKELVNEFKMVQAG